jgi:hypothetical protein
MKCEPCADVAAALQILYLTPSARAQFSSGRIFSHVTSDAETIYQLSTSGLGLISSPVRIIGALLWPHQGSGFEDLGVMTVLCRLANYLHF